MSARIWAVALVPLLTSAASCGKEVPVYDGEAWRRDPPAVGPLFGKILTSNSYDDSISVVDPETPGAPPRALPVGFNPVELEGPHHLVADPGGRFVYVNLSLSVRGSGSGPHGVHGAGDLPGYALKLDARTGREVGRAQVDPNPGDSTISADGRTLFVTHYDILRWHNHEPGAVIDSNLVLVDTESMTVRVRVRLCPAAHGVRLSRDGRFVYAACGPDEIAVVDLQGEGTPVARLTVPGGRSGGITCQRCPYTLGVAPDGTVWVSNLGPNNGELGRGSLDVFDPAVDGQGPGGRGAFDSKRSLLLAGSPMFAAFAAPADSAAGAGAFRVIVPEQRAGGRDFVRVYDPGAAGSPPVQVASVELDPQACLNAHQVLVSADGARGHLVCEGNHTDPGTFAWLDLGARSVLGWVRIGVFPDGLVLLPKAPP